MKILSVLLIFSFLLPSLSFAKRRRTSNFKRQHAWILNTQNLLTYAKDEKQTNAEFNLAYAYNMGNFEVQPYLGFSVEKPGSGDLGVKNLLLGLALHFNIIENRRGKRWVPYILASAAYSRPAENESGYQVGGGAGFKYFVTSRFVLNPEILYNHKSTSTDGAAAKTSGTVISNLNFRYYF